MKHLTWDNIIERFNTEVADKAQMFVTASQLAKWLETNYNAPTVKNKVKFKEISKKHIEANRNPNYKYKL